MDPKRRLVRNLVAESEAYGYTLTIWGAGGLLIDHYGSPGLLDVFFYVGGALAGFGVLAAVAFDYVVTDLDEDRRQVLVVSMIHVLATTGNLLVSFVLIEAVGALGFPPWPGFLAVGFQATVTYNLLLSFEQSFTETLVESGPLDGDADRAE
ncbi:hypothetical protein BRC82_05005 [Halobacteriales archaeon QS_1_67_19]|nr:MAG: hypothetical protein BRC82_05005 [Halobacteriales archaeon QS_1_67_19]